MARDIVIKFRVSEDEAERIKKNAEKARMSISRYLRSSALENKIKVFDMAAVNELALQFHKIGVNINQITAMVNQTQTVYKNDIENLNKEISKMKNNMENLLLKFERDNIDDNKKALPLKIEQV